MMYVPRGSGIFGGMMGIVLVVVRMVFSGGDDIGSALAVILLLIPVFAAIAWNRFGRRLMDLSAKGDKETADRLADTVESLFFVAVLVTVAVMYNMGLFIL